nr:NERD domain-containing protein [Streptomyces cinnamoneus]
MLEGRWTTVTESGYEHERRGLDAIRKRLRDEEPWRAWSNFVFTANSGHVREVDLLVTSSAGVFLVELKDWHGSVSGGGHDWVQTTSSGIHQARSRTQANGRPFGAPGAGPSRRSRRGQGGATQDAQCRYASTQAHPSGAGSGLGRSRTPIA